MIGVGRNSGANDWASVRTTSLDSTVHKRQMSLR